MYLTEISEHVISRKVIFLIKHSTYRSLGWVHFSFSECKQATEIGEQIRYQQMLS